MRPPRPSRNPFSVSLFPFLAVLICTLGVLIVMLVMAVHSAEMSAKSKMESENADDQQLIKQLQSDLEMRQVQVEGMELVRPEALERLTNIRDHRSRVSFDTRDLIKQLEALRAQLAQPVDAVLETATADLDQQIEAMTQQLARESDQLKVAREIAKQTSQKLAYWIIPSGNGGAGRRPIYVECDDQGLTLQPYGIKLNKQDFARPVTNNNPLDQAFVTIGQYWSRYDIAGDQGKPYPLLVVRPGGAQAYLLARHAMKSWDDEFGYELIEDEKQLDFGVADEQLKKELADVIAQSKEHQRTIIANQVMRRPVQLAAGSGGGSVGNGMRGGLIASATKGGFEAQNASYANSIQSSNPAETQTQPESGFKRSTESGQNGSASFDSASKASGASKLASSKIQPLAAQRGKNWALPNFSPGSTAYVRPIRVFCSANQLEVRSPAGQPVRIPIGHSSAGSVDQLIEGVWRIIESWGTAGQNGYWKPELHFTVLPGAAERFNELCDVLESSGVGIVQDSDQSRYRK